MIRFFVRQLVSFIFLWLPLLILFCSLALGALHAEDQHTSMAKLRDVRGDDIGGFSFYDPVLMRFYRWGFLTSLAGLLTSIVGKGKLRWPSCGLSVLMTFLWFAAALGE